jgi:hypothetical protein
LFGIVTPQQVYSLCGPQAVFALFCPEGERTTTYKKREKGPMLQTLITHLLTAEAETHRDNYAPQHTVRDWYSAPLQGQRL